ncbi:hypothetical protein E2C01_076182 [Portunus trituberculatus]|uniref:Uncharacterized protein n=1 Tax=Portunus trituberculatus TaxID=210409 RepID=A0A5B7ILC8_PORTR|nr:hypothetical protein [Portunus trituberculatus]
MTVSLLAMDCFVDALHDSRLQIYVKQAHPKDVQEALNRAYEMEGFLRTTTDAPRLVRPVVKEKLTPCPLMLKLLGRRWVRRTAGGRRVLEDSEEPAGDVANWAINGSRKSCQLAAAPTAVCVAGTVNECSSVQLVVDMGSEKAFMSSVPEAAQQLCGVTGQCVAMWRPVMVNIGMGSVLKSWPVLISVLEDPCPLGIDFLTRVGASLDLRERKSKVRSQEVSLIFGSDSQRERSEQEGGVSCQAGEGTQCRQARGDHST